MLQETCANGFSEVKKRVREIRLTRARKECERQRATGGLFLASATNIAVLVLLDPLTPRQTLGTTDHSSDSLVTDWHLKTALTSIQATRHCTVTSRYLYDSHC